MNMFVQSCFGGLYVESHWCYAPGGPGGRGPVGPVGRFDPGGGAAGAVGGGSVPVSEPDSPTGFGPAQL